ncbi:hypothetical protein EDD22DRAFT_854786 [Suillus occidentalis]|nr:hypothetical protein EDD22DRAFT_854786 [Suillus occidentalis]
MTKTKQTALKSTGGPAKRGQLPTFKVTAGPAGKLITNRAFPKALPPAFSVMKDVGKDIATKGITNVIRSAPEPSFWNDKCVVIAEESVEEIKGSDVYFTCPGCHEMRGKRTSPYYGFEDAQGTPILTVHATINGHIELTSRSQICNSPILILNLILDGVNPSGSPARIMRNVLEPYVAGKNLQYHEVVFDIGTLEKAERHAKSMKALANKVKDIPFERVEIFVHTHSETIRGDLWGGFEDAALVGKKRKKVPNFDDPIAYTVDDFFQGVFVGGIEVYLKGANLWIHEVEHVFAFGAERFHASLVAAFALAYTERVLVEGFEVRDTMPNLLAVSPQLGMHASVIIIQLNSAFRRRPITIVEYHKPVRLDEGKVSMTVTTYTFFDENCRPWGNVLPYQCLSCKCVRPWKRITPSIGRGAIVAESKFCCRNPKCGYDIAFTKPDKSKIILFTQGYRKSNDAGAHKPKRPRARLVGIKDLEELQLGYDDGRWAGTGGRNRRQQAYRHQRARLSGLELRISSLAAIRLIEHSFELLLDIRFLWHDYPAWI